MTGEPAHIFSLHDEKPRVEKRREEELQTRKLREESLNSLVSTVVSLPFFLTVEGSNPSTWRGHTPLSLCSWRVLKRGRLGTSGDTPSMCMLVEGSGPLYSEGLAVEGVNYAV